MDAHVNKSIRSGHFQHILNMISASTMLHLLQTAAGAGRQSSERSTLLESASNAAEILLHSLCILWLWVGRRHIPVI